jgi:hypothetical protein
MLLLSLDWCARWNTLCYNMSLSFAGFPSFSYIGTVFGQPMQIAGVRGRAVKLSFNWLAYGASSLNQNVVVNIQLSGGSPTQIAPLLDLIRSVYIDNTGSPDAVYVQFPDTGFTIVAQPNSIGWYPVFTNLFAFQVAIFGVTSSNVPSCLMYITNVKVDAFTDVAVQEVAPQNLASPSLGGGSSLSSIVPIINGSCYNNGNLAITGGGGTGATALGLLDQFGRFLSVEIENGGGGFTGLPVITPTGGQTIPAAFNPAATYTTAELFTYLGTVWGWFSTNSINVNAAAWINGPAYADGTQVSYGGSIYVRVGAPGSVTGVPSSSIYWSLIGSQTPINGNAGWVNSGTAPGVVATFQSVLSAASNPIISNGYGVPALGDNAGNYIDDITGLGVFRNNLFGTPYAIGFIYLTHLYTVIWDASAANTWTMGNSDGYIPFTFIGGAVGEVPLSLQKMNMKLDATVNWRLACTTFGGVMGISTGFAFTYSQQ